MYSSSTYTFCSKINGNFYRPELVIEKFCTNKISDNIENNIILLKKPQLKRSKSILIPEDSNKENYFDNSLKLHVSEYLNIN